METVFVVVALGETFPLEIEAFRIREDAEKFVIGLARQYCDWEADTYQDARNALWDIWQERSWIWKREVR